MVEIKGISLETNKIHGIALPEDGYVVGYMAIKEKYGLKVPVPKRISIVSKKNRQYEKGPFQIKTIRYLPEDNLYKHLVFALKYEGINLSILKSLFLQLAPDLVEKIIALEPTSQYSRKIWFLYEWLLDTNVEVSNAATNLTYVKLVDDRIQYSRIKGEKSSRHRIINNLLGTRDFCPHVYKSDLLQAFEQKELHLKQDQYKNNFGKALLQRASSFLLLADSKASYTIEGEKVKNQRLIGWSRAIGKAGKNKLNIIELERLQHLVLEKKKHIKMGLREEGGFIGVHDKDTFEPIPEHISARAKDLEVLIDGICKVNEQLIEDEEFDPIIMAAIISFGFVFIHPFVDGNGRIHRYLIHHILSKKGFSHQGIIFPISAAILDKINDYQNVLTSNSNLLLEYIQWQSSNKHNVEVLNETMDLYSYFDCTEQSEFLYACVWNTINEIIPNEIKYLQAYDEFKLEIEREIGLADNQIDLLIKLMMQHDGKLSNRKKEKHFPNLNEAEVDILEQKFENIFKD